jgi:hypothetical protein
VDPLRMCQRTQLGREVALGGTSEKCDNPSPDLTDSDITDLVLAAPSHCDARELSPVSRTADDPRLSDALPLGGGDDETPSPFSGYREEFLSASLS